MHVNFDTRKLGDANSIISNKNLEGNQINTNRNLLEESPNEQKMKYTEKIRANSNVRKRKVSRNQQFQNQIIDTL